MNDVEELKDNLGSVPKIKGLIFEGGGAAGIAHVGAIEIFEEKGLLNDVEYLVGSSAGAIISGALACGAKAADLQRILFKTSFNQFRDDSTGYFRDIYRLFFKYGWYKGDEMEKWYCTTLISLGVDPKITFSQVLEKFGKYLVITVTDVNTGKTIYHNPDNSPDMEIKIAVRRSSSLPIFFKADSEYLMTKVLEDGHVVEKSIEHYFTDGGLLANYPIDYLDDKLLHDEVVGFKLMSSKELYQIYNPHVSSQSTPPGNIVDYILMLFTILRNQALQIHVKESDWERTVKVDVGTISSTDFDLTETDKNYLVDQGKKAAIEFLLENESRRSSAGSSQIIG